MENFIFCAVFNSSSAKIENGELYLHLNSDAHYPKPGGGNFNLDGCGRKGWGDRNIDHFLWTSLIYDP